MPTLETAACPSCGRDNPPDAVFCGKCIAPLGVKKLHDLDAHDFRICAAALAETLNPPQAPTEETLGLDAETAALLEAYLNLHWLRPETALWQTLDALAVHRWPEDCLGDPLLDLGCGDGTHAATIFGTRFQESFDVFVSLELESADIFDAFDPKDYRPAVSKRGSRIAFGIDIRPNMVRRAATLGVYDKIMVGDATQLPLPEASVRTVYSNVIRDFPDDTCRAALSEIARILAPGGFLLLPSCTPTWKQSLYFYPRARALAADQPETSRQLAALDRGRSISFAQQISAGAWRDRLAPLGLEVVDRQPTHSQAVARFWDTGLRPFAVPLLRWVRTLPPDRRLLVKRAFIRALTGPLHRLLTLPPEPDCPHVMFLVRKRA